MAKNEEMFSWLKENGRVESTCDCGRCGVALPRVVSEESAEGVITYTLKNGGKAIRAATGKVPYLIVEGKDLFKPEITAALELAVAEEVKETEVEPKEEEVVK